MSAPEMTGRRCLVVGSTGGIGSAVIASLEAAGAAVVGIDREDFQVTTTEGAVAAVAHAERELGGLDAVVHAIGLSGRRFGDGPVSSATDEGWDTVLTVNLGSVFRMLRASFPALAASGSGSFVAVGSVLAESADLDFLTVAYAASKAGLIGLVRTSAIEGAQHGIRVNVVAPGLVDTPMARRALGSDGISGRMGELQPLHGRAVTAEEVADAVAWLASPASAMTTGHVLAVDGGWLLR